MRRKEECGSDSKWKRDRGRVKVYAIPIKLLAHSTQRNKALKTCVVVVIIIVTVHE